MRNAYILNVLYNNLISFYQHSHDVGKNCGISSYCLHLLPRSTFALCPWNQEQTLHYRRLRYHHSHSASTITVPLLDNLAEKGRLIIAITLIPTCFLPRSWIVLRFASLMAYVFYICTIYNLYIFHTYFNIGQTIFHLLVLIKFIFIIVDDLTNIDLNEIKEKRRRSLEKQALEVKAEAQKTDNK